MAKQKVKKVTVAKGVKIPLAKEKKMREKKGSSNTGKYKDVSPNEFAGSAGGASKFSYPINTKKRAKAALAYAHNAPNPSGIKAKVHEKYPKLGKADPKKKRKSKRSDKIGIVMHEFKEGALKSGSGKTVTNPKQAIAIGISEAKKKNKK